MNVLIVTFSQDNESISLVTKAVEARGGRVVRLDTDKFPTQHQLITTFSEGKTGLTLVNDEGTHDLSTITAVWYRRSRVGDGIPVDLDRQMRAPSVEESKRTLHGMLSNLDAFCMDPYYVIRAMENKQLQLKYAQQLGMDIPKTLITNSPAAVRSFAASCENDIIAKMQASFAVYEDGVENVMFTNVVDEKAMEELDSLKLCPMTFQEKVEKKVELRVTVVGDQVFTAAVDSQASERSKVDWRKDGVGLIDKWVPYDLPDNVREKLLKMMDRLGLNYGAADFIVTPDDRYVFLEVNPAGEWFWLDVSTGFPIAEAIADLMLGKIARRGATA